MKRNAPPSNFFHAGRPARPSPLDTLKRRAPWILLGLGLAATLLIVSRLNPANRTLWLLAAAFPALAGLGLIFASLSRPHQNANRPERGDILVGRDREFHGNSPETRRSHRVTKIGRSFTTGTTIEETTWTGTLDDLPPDVREHVRDLLRRARPHPNNPDIRIAEETLRQDFTNLDDMPPDLRRKVEDILEDHQF